MTRLPRLKGKEIVRILERMGFRIVRTRGSHLFLKHSGRKKLGCVARAAWRASRDRVTRSTARYYLNPLRN